ncbi:MAG: cell division protein ZapB [Acidobacteria bacterium]|nr:cell division protein ZapB [Acidobacteriota bacterium]MCY4636370.1 cell division protein ZapB [Acidobacteriota bacterium]
MSETAQYVDLATVDRLAQKVTGLVQILERTRQELAEARSDNERLNEEVGALRENLTAARHETEEVETLRAERDQVRARVAEMLDQLEALDL